jgi:tetratricopeptide (TPR) repeat protein
MLVGSAPVEQRASALHEARDYRGLAALLEAQDAETVASSAQLAFWLADAWRRLGRGPDALGVLRAAAHEFGRRGNDPLERHRLNLEGMLRFEAGDVARAEECFRELLALASAASDDDFVARANNNLGVIYTLHGRAQEAIACYERALAADRRVGRRRGLAQAHQNLGITYRELDFYHEADHHFLQAIRYAAVDGSTDLVARAEQERALLIYLSRRDAPLARAWVQRALRRFDALRQRGGAADALRVLGMIELGVGDLTAASALLEQAVTRARAVKLPLVEAEALEALAAVAERRGDADRAQLLQVQASQIFHQLGATAWGQRTRERVTRLSIASH